MKISVARHWDTHLKNKHCYIMGDYNINLLNYENHQPIADFIDPRHSNSFVSLINKPTRGKTFSYSGWQHIYKFLEQSTLAKVMYVKSDKFLKMHGGKGPFRGDTIIPQCGSWGRGYHSILNAVKEGAVVGSSPSMLLPNSCWWLSR